MVQLNRIPEKKNYTWSENFFLNNGILVLTAGTSQVCSFRSSSFAICNTTSRAEQVRTSVLLVYALAQVMKQCETSKF